MAEPRPGSVERPWGWAVAFASLVLIMAGYGGNLLLLVTLKTMSVELAWPREAPSLAYASHMVGVGIGGIVMGWWSERVGMGPPIVLSALAMAAGLFLMSRMTEPWQACVIYGLVIGAIGNGALFSPLIANLTRWFDRRRGMAVAVAASGQAVGGTVLATLFRWSNDEHGWRATYEYYAVVALCVMLPLAFVVRPRAPIATAHAEAAAVDRPVLGLPPLLVTALLGLAIVLCCVGMAMPLVHLVAHVSDLGFSLARGAEALSLILFASFFSRIGLGALSDRIGGFRTLLAGSAVQAAAIALFMVADGLATIYAVAVLFGLGFGGIVPSYAIIVREIFPVKGSAWRIAVVFSAGTFGMAVGGWLGGRIFDATGSYHDAFLLGLSANLANLAIVAALYRRRRRRRGAFGLQPA